MKKKFLLVGIIFLITYIVISGCINAVSKEFNGDYESNEQTVLRVVNINGDITIESWNDDKITLKAVTTSHHGNEKLDEIKIEVREIDNIIDIETIFLGSGLVEANTKMNIKIPEFVNIEKIFSSNGDIAVLGGKGNVTVHSSNGNIDIVDVDGYVQASSSNGNINIEDTTGVNNITTSNGKINLEIFDFNKNISISSSNEDIILFIHESLNADLILSTSNGKISTNNISLNITKDEEKYLSGELGTGGNSINIETSNGDINLKKLTI
jgi:hypothetical protein